MIKSLLTPSQGRTPWSGSQHRSEGCVQRTARNSWSWTWPVSEKQQIRTLTHTQGQTKGVWLDNINYQITSPLTWCVEHASISQQQWSLDIHWLVRYTGTTQPISWPGHLGVCQTCPSQDTRRNCPAQWTAGLADRMWREATHAWWCEPSGRVSERWRRTDSQARRGYGARAQRIERRLQQASNIR